MTGCYVLIGPTSVAFWASFGRSDGHRLTLHARASLIVFFFAADSYGMRNEPLIIMGEMFPMKYRTTLGTVSSYFRRPFLTIALMICKDVIFADQNFYFGNIKSKTLEGIGITF